MSEDVPDEKKLIRAPGNLVSKLSEAANRQGKTFYSYVSEILEQAVRAYEMNHGLKEIIDAYEILEVYKEAGTVFAPRDFVEYLIGKAYGEDKETLQKLWHQAGKWCGVYLKEKSNDAIDAFVRLLEEGRWDMSEVTMKRNQEALEFKCVSTLVSQERTELMRRFIEGAMHSLGYESKEHECFRGIIRLRFLPLVVP